MRELVGRAALFVLGAALLWGGVKAFAVGVEMQRSFNAARSGSRAYSRDSSGAFLPMAIGIVLIIAGSVLAISAMIPIRIMEKLFGEQRNNTLFDTPNSTQPAWVVELVGLDIAIRRFTSYGRG